ncbi:MAG: hypothetical protein M0Z43_00715 [Acidithiobacillus sp.]|nr:hypothetical protein [Acidithiobacillus sp.]
MIKRLLIAALFLFVAPLSAYAVNCSAGAGGTCYWIGGTGTLDLATDSAHWSDTTGGATCTCEPTTTSTLIFDGSSGGGVVTVNVNIVATEIQMGAFTGTLDFATNNNNVTLSLFNGSGTGTRTLNMGSGVWTINGGNGVSYAWTMQTTTGLTFSGASATIDLNTDGGYQSAFFYGGALTYHDINIGPWTTNHGQVYAFSGNATFDHFSVTGPANITISSSTTITVNNPMTWTTTAAASVLLQGFSATSSKLATAGTSIISWVGMYNVTFSGLGTVSCTSCFNFGNNSGESISFTAPSSGGGFVIGG